MAGVPTVAERDNEPWYLTVMTLAARLLPWITAFVITGCATSKTYESFTTFTCSGELGAMKGHCTDGISVLVPYEVSTLRNDPALDPHATFEGTPIDVIGAWPQLGMLEVKWLGVGNYRIDLRDTDPWWATEPLLLSRSRELTDVQAEGASATVMSQTYQDMGWSLWQNAIRNNLPQQVTRRQAFIDAGVPILGYLEGTGNLLVFLAAIDQPPELIPGTDVTQTPFIHWNWGDWGGGPLPAGLELLWIGPHTYYNAPSYAEPYTRNHPIYGDTVTPTAADGTPISTAGTGDPRTYEFYRRCAATDINGEPALSDLSWQDGRDVTGLPGVVTIEGTDYSLLGFARDLACPTWLRYTEITLRYAIDNGTTGSWMDNVSMWDAWGLVPAGNAFGEHAIAGFENWLSKKASADFMQRSSLEVPAGWNMMNMRCIIKEIARTGFGENLDAAGECDKPIALNHTGLMDPRWDTNLAWGAWVAYHSDLHIRYYHQMREMLDGLDPDFLWGVNDLPHYGAIVGESVPPSMNLGEQFIGFSIIAGGVTLPPTGTVAPLYDVAGRFDQAQFQTTWLYVDDVTRQESAELHRALAAEALAYDTFLMPSATDPRAPGTTASARKIHSWLLPHARELEGRQLWSRTAIVFSADTWLRTFRPGGLPNTGSMFEGANRKVRNLGHLYEVAGWHRTLEERSHNVQPLLAGRITADSLAEIDLLLLPDVQVLPQRLRDSIIDPWVQAGGTLVVSGNTGRYRGRDELYDLWSANGAPTALSRLTGISDLSTVSTITEFAVGAGRVFIIPERPGADAWLGLGTRALHAAIAALQNAGALDGPVVSPPTGTNVTARVHVDVPRGRTFIDFVNRNYDAAGDQLPTAAVSRTTIKLPAWMQGTPLLIRTAANRGSATVSIDDDQATVTVEDLDDIVTVILETPLSFKGGSGGD